MKIPSDNRWYQTNEGDILGPLHDTFRCSLDETGKIRQSKKPFALYSSDIDGDYGYTMAIVYFNDKYIAVTDDEAFSFDLANGTVTKIASTPTTTLATDAIVVYGRMYVTIADNLSYWNGSSWTNTIETLTTAVPHPMAIFDSLTTYKLAIGDANTVILVDSSGNKSATVLTLPSQYRVTTLAYRNGYLYVGTRNMNGGEARIFIWDGDTANANYDIPVGGSWVFSIAPYLTSVAAVIDTGEIILVTGNSYTRLAAFPVYFNPNALWQGDTGLTLNGKVFHRGMKAVGRSLYINIDGDVETGFIPEMRSGLWIYDPDTGLTHAASSPCIEYVSDTSLSVSNSVITTSAAHNLKTGDAVMFTGISGLTGVDDGVVYYVSVESTTTIKLAKSRKALKNSYYVTIGGTAAAGDILVYVPNTDHDTDRDPAPGAVGLVSPSETPIEMWSYPVIWGARADKPDGTAFYGLYGMTDSWTISRFSTQRIYGQNIIEAWQAVFTFLEGCNLTNEQIIVKAQTGQRFGYPTNILQGVWGSATTIHSVSTTLDEDEWRDIELGDEITIVDGTGRGYTAHVSAAPEHSSGTSVITIDESIGTLNDAVYFYVDSFKKLGTITSTRERNDIAETGLDTETSWVRLKFEMRGFGIAISMLDLISKVQKKSAK